MKTLRPLNSDELGEKGERRFGEICADAKLICNKSQRERTGWDFIVEFDRATATSTFDKRDFLAPCHFQVKTIWSDNSTIWIRLSSAERLAKDPNPSFLYVFRVDEKLQFVDAHIIHLLDAPLAKILKRLRQEESQKTTALNAKTISFDVFEHGTKLPPSGSALRRLRYQPASGESRVGT